MKRTLFLFILINTTSTVIFGQEKASIDSVINHVINNYQGSQQLNQLNALSKSIFRKVPDLADSINHLVLNSNDLKTHAVSEGYLYKNIGALQAHLGNFDSSTNALRKSLGLFRNIQNTEGIVRVTHNLSNVLQDNHQLDSAIIYEKIALSNSVLKKDSFFIQVTGKGLGTKFRSAGNLDSAVFYLTFTLKYSKANSKSQANLFFALGNVFISKEDYKKAETYLLKSLKYFQPKNTESILHYIYNSLGAAKTGLYEYDSAAHYYDKSIVLGKKFNDTKLISDLYSNIGTAYNFMQKYDTAIHLSTIGANLANEHGHNFSEAMNILTIATGYSGLKKWSEVKESAYEALAIFDNIGRNEKRLEAYELVAEAEYRLKNYEQAFLTQKILFENYKTFLNSEKEKTISELETQYETEKKEAEIATLSQKATIQALEIQQKNQGIVIGLILMLLLSGGAYFIYRQRISQREKSQIEIEQRFLRSQLNPHFIFNALLAIQNFMLKNDAKTASVYLTKFSKLMREILENSRQEFIPVESELKMLTNYLDIHKLRLNNSFEYKVDIDENIDAETDTIPPMFIQPFIENAIEHGIISANGKGMIELRFTKNEEYISIEVKDNGGGLAQLNQKNQNHTSLASTIIQERMALFNKSLKNKIQLVLNEIKNEYGEIQGTRVELKVPFNYV